MNPLIMNADELVRWYKPQTEMEKHLLSVMAELMADNSADLDSRDEEINELETEIEDLKSQIANQESSADEKDDTILDLRTEIERLEILVDELGEKLEALEGTVT
jgi:peptidoglycan hydrolase CwlO-like protein